LAHALQSFLLQDYPADRCELIILDDANQYVGQSHIEPKPWTLISCTTRFRTMGEKRNASAAFVSPDADALVPWDDDDIYLPHTLRAHAAALANAPWSRPSEVFCELNKSKVLKQKPTGGLFHAAWAFRVDAFKQVHGYPWIQSGQDQGLGNRMKVAGIKTCDPITEDFGPFFVARWGSTKSYHLSAMHKTKGYDRLARYAAAVKEKIEVITPCWPLDYSQAKAGHATPVFPEERSALSADAI
jgi:hypothetical protein